MEFNPLKCEYMNFSRKRTKGAESQYILHNVKIPEADGVRYLGVKLESSLRWNDNSTFITNKTFSRLGYIRRNIPLTLPPLRANAYTTLVRPILEYSFTVWDGSLTQTQVTKLEAVQRNAARRVHNIPRTDHHTSTSQLINKLNREILDSRRELRRLWLFRAIHFGVVATDMTEYIVQIHRSHSRSTQRHDQQYLIPHTLQHRHIKTTP